MNILASASEAQKKEIVVDILSAITTFDKEEIRQGLEKCVMFKIENILRAVFKTDMRDTMSRTMKLFILGSHLGDRIIADKEVRELILAAPDVDDGVILLALFMFSNPEKVRPAFTKKKLSGAIFITHPE